jgi:hypothetical protein
MKKWRNGWTYTNISLMCLEINKGIPMFVSCFVTSLQGEIAGI